MYTSRRGNIHSITCIAIGCGVAAVLFALIDRPNDVPPSVVAAQRGYSVELVDTPPPGNALLAVPAAPNESITLPKLSPEDLYERVAPSVVTIIVKDEDGEAIGSGSGFLIDEAMLSERYDSLDFDKQFARSRNDAGTPTQFGYVLTNYHVIRPAISANIVLCNGDEGAVWHVMAEDENADLALLFAFFSSNEPLKGIPFAAHNPRVLTTVYAIGSPKGLSGSASEGKVSGLRGVSTGEQWLQTTAPISPGSSGGPLLLSDGTLAGVTTMFLKDAQNLNFAIPVSSVRTFLATTEFRTRDVAEGASIRWHEDNAFDVMKLMVESELIEFSDAERRAIALVQNARNEVADVRAIEMAREAAKSLPDRFKYLAHYIAGYSSSLAAVQAVHSSNPNYQFTTTEFASRYRASDHARAALHHLTETTRLKPDFAPAYERLYVHYAVSGDRANALLLSNALVDIMPRCASALNQRAQCYSELNQPESAKHDLGAAIELSPKCAPFYSRLADVLVDLGHYTEAIAAYESAIELQEFDLFKDDYYFDMGIAYYKAGNFEKAISAFTQAKNMGYPAEWCDPVIAECRQRQR